MPTAQSYISSLKQLLTTDLVGQGADERTIELAWLLLFDVLKKQDLNELTPRQIEQALEEIAIPTATGTNHPETTALQHLKRFVRTHHLSQREILLQGYLLALQARGCSKATIKNYLSDIRQLFAISSEQRVEESLTETRLIEFIKKQESSGLAQRSIRRKLTTTAQFAKWLLAEGVIEAARADSLYQLSQTYAKPESKGNQTMLLVLPTVAAAAAQPASVVKLTTDKKPIVIEKTAASHQLSTVSQANVLPNIVKPTQSKKTYNIRRFLPKVTMQGAVTALALLLSVLGLSLLAWMQFLQNVDQPLAYPTALTRPTRSLSFQGRLTNSAQSPITTATDMNFKLYNSGPATTSGTILWDSGTCSVDPDQDGIFSTGLGDDCGSEIDDAVFSENTSVWLQISVGTSPVEVLAPRQPIKAVAYALNSETLQGYPASASAVENTVIVMNNAGEIVLGNYAPKIISTGAGGFTIEGQTLTLATSTGSNGNVNLSPDGTGLIMLNGNASSSGTLTFTGTTDPKINILNGENFGISTSVGGDAGLAERVTILNNGNVGIGSTTPGANLDVTGTGRFSSTLTASNGFTLTAGTLSLPNDSVTDAMVSNTLTASLFVGSGSTTTAIDLATAEVAGILALANGGTNKNMTAAAGAIAYSDADSLELSGIGVSGQCLLSGATGAPTWGDCALATGTSKWQLAPLGGAISPYSDTLDLLIGGTATTSAKFAFMNVNSGTPTASISGNLAISVPTGANPAVKQNVYNGGSLGFQTSVGGDASLVERMTILNNGNVGIGTTAPGFKLELAGTGSVSDRKLGINGTQVLYLPDQTSFTGSLILGNGGTNLSHTSGSEGFYNTFAGIGSGTAVTTGSGNTALGHNSMTAVTTGTANVAIGRQALVALTSGIENVVIGASAGEDLLDGSDNTIIGQWSGATLTSATNNTIIGEQAAYGVTTGYGNVVVGSMAGPVGAASADNTSVGTSALASATTNNNTALGSLAGLYSVSGANNLFLGYGAGSGTGQYYLSDNNLIIGYEAAKNIANDADYNTVIGYQAGYTLGAADVGNIYLGYQAGYSDAGSNKLYIENSNSATPLIYGDFSTDQLVFNANVGIGTTITPEKLTVSGNATISGTLALGPMPTVDAGTCDAAAKGKQYMDGVDNKMYYCNGTSWTSVSDTEADTLATVTGRGNSTATGITLTTNGLTLTGVTNDIISGGTNEHLALMPNGIGNVGIGSTGPGAKLDVTGSIRSSGQLISTVATGTPPLVVSSTDLVTNLNADYLDNYHVTTLPFVNNTANTTLTRAGVGPYTLALNLGNANTWTGAQTFTADTNFDGTGADGIWTSTGNVGIGTITPGSYVLSVNGTTNIAGLLTSTAITNTGALTSTGGIVSLNASSNFAVNIGTGTTLSAVTIGGNANDVIIDSDTWKVSSLGAATGLTGISSSGTINFSGLTASLPVKTDASKNLVSGAIDLASGEVTGTLPVGNGGTGATTLTGMLKGNGTGALSAVTNTANYVTFWSDANTISGEAQLATSRGGLGANVTAIGAGELLYSTAATTYDSLAAGTSGNILMSGGAAAPTWSAPAALTKVDDTNITATLGGSASTALINAASITLGWTGQLSLARGGTNQNITPAAGAVVWTDADSMEVTAAGSSGQVLKSNGTTTPTWVDLSTLPAGDATTLDTLDSLQFLRSDTSDSFTSGTLTTDAATTLDVNGNLAVADTDIVLDGATTNFTATGNLSINTDDFVVQKSDGNIGIGTTAPAAFKLQVAGHVGPQTDDTYDLGSSSLRWRDLYLGPTSLHLVSTIAETATARDWKLGLDETDGATDGNFRIMEGASQHLTIKPDGNVGIGSTSPAQKLDVVGNVAFTGALMPNGSAGTLDYFLRSAGAGAPPVWADMSALVLPSGTTGQTLRHNGTNWIANSILYNDGTNVGIGTTVPGLFRLNVSGDANISGALTVGAGLTVTTGTVSLPNDQIGDAELANAVTISGGTLGSNTITAGSAWTNSGTLDIGTSSWDISAAGAASGFTGIASSGDIDLSALAAGGLVKAAVTTGRLSIASSGTDYEVPLTFNNGLTRTVNAVGLGGTLLATTDIAQAGYDFTFSGTGNVGIGTTTPTSKLEVLDSGVGGSDRTALLFTGTTTTSGVSTSRGLSAYATFSGTSGTLTGLQGIQSVVTANGTGGTVSYAEAHALEANVSTGATITNLSLLKLNTPNNSGTIGTLKGIEIKAMTGGSNNWALYQEGASDRSYFAGNVGIGSTDPQAKLEITGDMLISGGINAPLSPADDNIAFHTNKTDDTTVEWLGFYSGAQRQGMIAYDGTISGCMAGTDVLCLYADNANYLNLHSDTGVILTGGNVGVGTTTPARKLDVLFENANTDALATPFAISRSTSGTAANGIGGQLEYYIEDNAGALQEAATIGSIFTDVTAGSVDSALVFQTRLNSGAFTEQMRIAADGNVGIGTTSVTQKLHIQSAAGSPATTGTTQNGIFRLTNASNNLALDFGQLLASPYTSWIQNGDKTALGTEYPLALNPNGGNVGIGTTNPLGSLEVAGEVISTGANQFRMIYGNYGSFFRNDGTNTYLLLTNSADQYGTWNSFRPFAVNDATGNLTLAGGGTTLTVTGASTFNATGTFTDQLRVGTSTAYSIPNGAAAGSFVPTFGITNSTTAGLSITDTTGGFSRRSGMFINATSGVWGLGNTYGTGSYLPFVLWTGGSERMRVEVGGNVGIGTTSADAKLHIAGGAVIEGTTKEYFATPTTTATYRNVAQFSINGSAQTGTIKIVLPAAKNDSATMQVIKISGYDYVDNGGAWEVVIGGYNHTSGWLNASAEIRGSAPFTSVRLGEEGSTNVILLGTTSTVWQYPQIYVDTLHAGYSNRDGFESTWTISKITSEVGITVQKTPSIKMYVQANGNVGIGTVSPSATLEVGTGTGATLQIDNPPAGFPALNIGRVGSQPSIKSTSDWLIMDSNTNPVALNYFTSQHVVLAQGGGNVGIGSTSPQYKLEVVGTGTTLYARGGTIGVYGSGTDTGVIGSTSSGTGVYGSGDNGVYGITVTGTGVYGTSTSSGTGGYFSSATGYALITNAGNVGIGTTAPAVPLQVQKAGGAGPVTYFYNTSNVDSADGIQIRIDDSTPGTNNNFIKMFKTGAVGIGSIRITAAGTGIETNSTGVSDFAEYFIKGEPIVKGELVKTKDGKVFKAKAGDALLGVIATSPGFTGNGKIEDLPMAAPVTISGLAPVIVVARSGEIHAGDTVTSSVEPGLGIKAIENGQIIGRAIDTTEDWNDARCQTASSVSSIVWPFGDNDGIHPCYRVPLSSFSAAMRSTLMQRYNLSSSDDVYVGKILTSITPQWYEPELWLTDTGAVQIGTSSNDYKVTQVSGAGSTALQYVGAAAQMIIGKIRAGLVTTSDLVVTNSASVANLTVSSLQVGGQSLTAYIENVVSNMQLNNSTSLPSGSFISELNTEDLTASGSATLGDTVADTLTVNKNASISGNLAVASDASIGGKLQANSSLLGSLLADTAVLGTATISGVTANNEPILDVRGSARMTALEAQVANLQDIRALTATLYDATISGTLYANTIDGLDAKVAAGLQPTLLQQLIGYDPASTDSAQLIAQITGVDLGATLVLDPSALDTLPTNPTLLGANAGFFEQYLQVNGNTALGGNLMLTGNLNMTSGMTIAGDSISYTPLLPDSSATLFIQPSGTGALDLMNGLALLENGAVTITGDVTFTKNITVAQTLFTDLLAPTSYDAPFQVKVAGVATDSGEIKQTRFEIINELDAPVATISAQGKADFAGGISVGRDALVSPDASGSATVNKTSGKAVIPAGATQIRLLSAQIGPDTLIYVTAQGDTQNQSLYIKNQVVGEAVIGFNTPLPADLRFNWWIVE